MSRTASGDKKGGRKERTMKVVFEGDDVESLSMKWGDMSSVIDDISTDNTGTGTGTSDNLSIDDFRCHQGQDLSERGFMFFKQERHSCKDMVEFPSEGSYLGDRADSDFFFIMINNKNYTLEMDVSALPAGVVDVQIEASWVIHPADYKTMARKITELTVGGLTPADKGYDDFLTREYDAFAPALNIGVVHQASLVRNRRHIQGVKCETSFSLETSNSVSFDLVINNSSLTHSAKKGRRLDLVLTAKSAEDGSQVSVTMPPIMLLSGEGFSKRMKKLNESSR